VAVLVVLRFILRILLKTVIAKVSRLEVKWLWNAAQNNLIILSPFNHFHSWKTIDNIYHGVGTKWTIHTSIIH